MKRLLTLSTLLLLSIMTFAQTLVKGIYYEFSGTEATVVYGSNKYTGDVTIPASVTSGGKTYSVTSIGYTAFEDCTGLTSVTIPNSVTSIEGAAFDGCSGLTSVTIPNSVTSIEYLAFSGCSGLTSVTIPNSVTSIGNRAFAGCSGLTSITIPNSVTSIEWAAFKNCSGLTSATIPNSVTRIGSSTFEDCTGLTSVTIPNSVTSIGSSAFSGTAWYGNQLDGLVYAGKVAYEYKGTMPENTSITIKDGTLGIADEAFKNCSGLTSATIPNSVTSIGNSAFYGCLGLTSITIPNSVTRIWQWAFRGCSGLTSIKVQDDNTKYDSRNNCNAIIETASNILIVGCKNTTIPNSVTSIEWAAFEDCIGLTSVTIPNSVTSIGNYAFYGCSGLTSVTIPNSVTSIGECAFYHCTGLTTIYSYIKKPTSATGSNFDNLNYKNATLYVPYGTKAKYQTTTGWNNFKKIQEMDNPSAINGVNAEDAKSFVGKIIKDNKIIIMKNGKKHSVSGQGM